MYTAKDVELLIVASTIVENATANKQFLQSKRANWTDQFFQNLSLKIDTAAQTHLGVDSAKELRQASNAVYQIQKTALENLSELKTQITQDFKKTPEKKQEILNNLGFTAHFKRANESRDQEALIDLLYQFKTNLTNDLKTEITEKGTHPQTLENILSQADNLRNANTRQEANKGNRKLITQEGIDVFNEIYEEIINICQISRKLYKGDSNRQDLFSFGKLVRALNNK